MNRCSLENMLLTVLSAGNKEQNQHYPPHIYEQHYRSVSSTLLSRIAEIYPDAQSVVDIAEPFLEVKREPVVKGVVKLANDYRNFLGAAVMVNKNKDGCCDDRPPDIKAVAFSDMVARGTCYSSAVRIVDQGEWDRLTTHAYKFPTYDKPIGCFFGKRELRICPFDLYAVELRFLKKEEEYRYGYILQPDDTYVYDKSLSVEAPWTDAAFEPLFKGLNYLYSVYTRDQELREWSVELQKIGLI